MLSRINVSENSHPFLYFCIAHLFCSWQLRLNMSRMPWCWLRPSHINQIMANTRWAVTGQSMRNTWDYCASKSTNLSEPFRACMQSIMRELLQTKEGTNATTLRREARIAPPSGRLTDPIRLYHTSNQSPTRWVGMPQFGFVSQPCSTGNRDWLILWGEWYCLWPDCNVVYCKRLTDHHQLQVVSQNRNR